MSTQRTSEPLSHSLRVSSFLNTLPQYKFDRCYGELSGKEKRIWGQYYRGLRVQVLSGLCPTSAGRRSRVCYGRDGKSKLLSGKYGGDRSRSPRRLSTPRDGRHSIDRSRSESVRDFRLMLVPCSLVSPVLSCLLAHEGRSSEGFRFYKLGSAFF